MAFSNVILWIMAFGAVLGGVDRVIGNRLGLGEHFEAGFQALGPLALSMVGIMCLSPPAAGWLAPVVVPLLSAIGADPSVFAGLVLANDMGGYTLAAELARTEAAGVFSGLVVASMMGCTVVFSIPVGLRLIDEADRPHFAKGLLLGVIAIPFGALVGGLLTELTPGMVLLNSIPVAVIAALLALGLTFAPKGMIRGCLGFGKVISAAATIGLIAAAFQEMTDVALIPGLAPASEALAVVGSIGVVLLGTFPVLALLTRALTKPLAAIGGKAGLDATSTAGLLFTMANPIPVFKTMGKMNTRGKIINTAWLVPVTAVFGDHLGFTAGVRPEAIGAVVAAKLAAGVLALAMALWATRPNRA